METSVMQEISSLAESLSTLALALVFIYYLVKQLSRRDELIFKDWERQRDKELQD